MKTSDKPAALSRAQMDKRLDHVLTWRSIAGASMALALVGCATTDIGADPESWPKASIEQATVMPPPEKLAPEVLNRRTRVVVMQPPESPTARGIGVPEMAVSTLETVLSKEGGVEIVDRKLAPKLDGELKLLEVRGAPGGASYNGPDVADFAVTLSLGAANWSSAYAQETSFVDKNGKKTIVSPAGHVHKGKSNITVRVYELPTMRLVMQQAAEGDVSVVGQPYAATGSQAASLIRTATEDAVSDVKGKLLTELGPKGYIVDRRAKEKKSIFRALVSKQTGAKQGDVVEIFSVRRSDIEFAGTKRTTFEQVKVAQGRVSNVVGNETSWIIVDDEKAASQVRSGDVVRVRVGNDINIPGLGRSNPLGGLLNQLSK